MAVIEVERYTKAYDDRLAVDDLSFEVEAGEILGFVGPNGAGKTTTLRALAGILKPTRGVLRIDGLELSRDALAAKSRLAFIPDDPHLFGVLTVWEHLEFTARVYGLSEFRARAEQVLQDFELLDRRDTLASELSRGMRQKVAAACALLHEPAALLLDEPMTGLDPRGIRTLMEAIRACASRGAAVIISSHLLGQIESFCNRFLILARGRRVIEGSVEQIRQALPNLREDASLEEVFFEAVEGDRGGDAV